jgi:DNA-binding NarL/FixJ family response regulator
VAGSGSCHIWTTRAGGCLACWRRWIRGAAAELVDEFRLRDVRAHPAGLIEVVVGLSPQEADVLTLLGAGLTDQAIARQLGVSLRTARRRINAIMTRVHGSTRFQAGAAAHRGWL